MSNGGLISGAFSSSGGTSTLTKVTKSYTDISSLEIPIYTLPASQALVNVFTDITTVFDVSTAVTIGDGSDDNGFVESADWTSSTGLTSATRGAYVTTFKTMRSTSGTTAISAYNFSTSPVTGTTFTQSSTDAVEELNPGVAGAGKRTQIGQRYEADQTIVGEDVCKATFYIASPTEDSTGTVNCYIRNGLGVLKPTGTNTTATDLDASELDASYVAHTFDFESTTIVADDMIMVSFANGDIGSSVIKLSTNTGNITNGEQWEQYGGVYQQKEVASMKQIVTYDCTPVVGDTQGVVDFYLQIAKE